MICLYYANDYIICLTTVNIKQRSKKAIGMYCPHTCVLGKGHCVHVCNYLFDSIYIL